MRSSFAPVTGPPRVPASAERRAPNKPGMTNYVALLRGINVGRAKRIAMAELRALIAGLGYGDVRTLLNSGNVVFSGSRGPATTAATTIERAIAAQLGVHSRVTVIRAQELGAALRENPLHALATDPSRMLIAVLNDRAQRSQLEPMTHERWEPEAFALGEGVAYLWCPDGILASRAFKAMERILGDTVTSRNLATMEKLTALAGA